MKKIWYKLLAFAVVLCAFAGCSSFAKASSYKLDDLTSVTESYLESWSSTDFSSYMESEEVSESDVATYQQWQDLKQELGEFESIVNTVNTEAEGEILSVCTAKFKNGTMTLTITYDSATLEQYGAQYATYAVKNIEAAKAETSAAKADMGKAAMNTLMGMGTVFMVLILISLVIAALKPVTGIILGNNKKKEFTETVKKEEPVSAPVLEPEENLAGDAELVAVVTAAIMAFEPEVAAEGLVVRSIRRRR